MQLVDALVERTTGPISSRSTLDCEPSEFAIAISDSILHQLDRIDDIRLSYNTSVSYPGGCPERSLVEVYDYALDTWCRLTASDPTDICHGLLYSNSQLLSAFSDDPEASFLGREDVIRVRGNVRGVTVEVFQYVDDVAWSCVVDHPEDVRPTAMACIGDEIWLVLTRFFCTGGRRGDYDSIIVIDSTGQRVSAFDPDVDRVLSLVQGDSVIWALTGPPLGISTIDRTGSTTHQFDIPSEFRDASSCLAWFWGLLWITDTPAQKLRAIRVGASLDSGYAVSDWGISLGYDLGSSSGMAWDGATILIRNGERLTRRNTTSQILGEWFLPVDSYWGSLYGVEHSEIAWDGEALWTLHYGPRYRPGAAMLLSRFRLPPY